MSSHDIHHRVEVLILEVLLSQAEDNQEEATEKLVRAVALAQPTDCIQPFIRFSSSLANLLAPLAETERHGEFVQRILATCHESEAIAPGGTPGDPSASNPLTYREQEALALLAQRCHNDEIAREMGISVETVKTHLSAMYKKLNVRCRRDAVSRAEARGLLVPRRNLPGMGRRRKATSSGEGQS